MSSSIACKRYLGYFQATFVLVILSFWMRVTNSQGWTTFGAVQEVLPGLKVLKIMAWEGRCVKDSPPKKAGPSFGPAFGNPVNSETFEEAFHFETLHCFFFQIHAFVLLGTLLVADLQLDVLKFNRWRSSSGHCEATSLASYLMDRVGFCVGLASICSAIEL